MSLSNITKTKKQRQVLTCLFVDRVVICETSAADLTTPTISENDTIFVQFFTVQSETENGGLYFLEYLLSSPSVILHVFKTFKAF